ncbi:MULTISPECIES: TPM domain-containing protein [unclassified Acidovorax]|uniref:TPM domain-containing protein n=1 Tax=unclassified Acidovorax TaxID=2684926 RepID=UPI002882FC81|nr:MULTISPECIES: TPM domain-containing protein [unclassified Acidovorax]
MPLALIHQALLAILFIATGIFSPSSATAQALLPVPALTARVIDQTGTLSPTDLQTLETKLAALELRNGSQVVVLMVPTTVPEDIAAYANRVASAWRIGRRDVGDGVIVLVAQQDRKMRIEVAKTLEGALPDIAAARIIDGAMKPRFQRNDFVGGLAVAIDQIGARIAGEALPLPSGNKPSNRSSSGSGFDWTDLAVFLFFGVMVAGPIARRIFGNRLGGVLLGGGAGGIALLVTSSLLIAGGVGVLALLYTWLFSGRGGAVWHGGSGAGSAGVAGGLGGWAGGASSGGWGGGSSGDGGGGGFSSGGGGDFGGGGASGDW